MRVYTHTRDWDKLRYINYTAVRDFVIRVRDQRCSPNSHASAYVHSLIYPACLDDYVVCKCIACILAFNGNGLINYESADCRISIPEGYVYITRVIPLVNV